MPLLGQIMSAMLGLSVVLGLVIGPLVRPLRLPPAHPHRPGRGGHLSPRLWPRPGLPAAPAGQRGGGRDRRRSARSLARHRRDRVHRDGGAAGDRLDHRRAGRLRHRRGAAPGRDRRRLPDGGWPSSWLVLRRWPVVVLATALVAPRPPPATEPLRLEALAGAVSSLAAGRRHAAALWGDDARGRLLVWAGDLPRGVSGRGAGAGDRARRAGLHGGRQPGTAWAVWSSAGPWRASDAHRWSCIGFLATAVLVALAFSGRVGTPGAIVADHGGGPDDGGWKGSP